MSIKTVVLNGDRMNYDHRLDFSVLSDEVKVYEETEPEQILERIQGFDIVVTKEIPIPGDIIRQFPNSVKLIVEAGTGYNNHDLEAIREKGLTLCNVPVYSTERVAHTAIMMIMNLSSSMRKQMNMLHDGDRTNFTRCMQVDHVEINGKTLGVISHSYAYGSMMELWINGKLASEHDLVGYCIGAHGVPVVFLSGDDLVIEDAKESIPGIYTAETKVAISNNSALCHHPKRNAKTIADTVEQAIRNYKKDGIRPMQIEGTVQIDVRYSAEAQAEQAMRAPNTIRLNENTVRYQAEDYLTAYRAFMTGTSLAGTFRDDADLYT